MIVHKLFSQIETNFVMKRKGRSPNEQFGKNVSYAIFLLLTMTFFISCSSDFKKVVALEYEGMFPDESATDIEIIMSEEGRINFILFTPMLNKYINTDFPFTDCPKGLIITSFDDFGEKQSILTADYAISMDKTEMMEARYNVVITNLKKNETLETEKIVWDKQNQRIYSDVEIRQIKADGTVNIGDGFDADEKFTKYSIKRPRCETIIQDI